MNTATRCWKTQNKNKKVFGTFTLTPSPDVLKRPVYRHSEW